MANYPAADVQLYRLAGSTRAALETALEAARRARQESGLFGEVYLGRAIPQPLIAGAGNDAMPDYMMLSIPRVFDAETIAAMRALRTEIGTPLKAAGAAPIIDDVFDGCRPPYAGKYSLSSASPRTLFVIGQAVTPANDADYNHWFDVDDRTSLDRGGPPIGHLEERLTYPGFLGGYRFKMASAPAVPTDADARHDINYFTAYELADTSALEGAAYKERIGKLRAGEWPLTLFNMLVRAVFVEM
jgi:hypothetical protein